MKVIYEAFDGIRFDNDFDCEMYEAVVQHPEIFSIIFYNSAGESYKVRHHAPFDDEVYQACEKINVTTNGAFECLKWITKYCGWSELEQITEEGIWERVDEDDSGGVWKKVNN